MSFSVACPSTSLQITQALGVNPGGHTVKVTRSLLPFIMLAKLTMCSSDGDVRVNNLAECMIYLMARPQTWDSPFHNSGPEDC